jgi:nucleotide-binding universal stress UspA family protein
VYKRVLVPLDGSELSESVLSLITDIAGPLDMTIVLLRVLEPVTPAMVEAAGRAVPDDLDIRLRDASEYLAPLEVRLRARGIETTSAVRVGRPEEEILAAARAEVADLIAMSTHGRSGLGRLLFGSVAEQVLRHADVPVFLMRQVGKRTAMPYMKETKR